MRVHAEARIPWPFPAQRYSLGGGRPTVKRDRSTRLLVDNGPPSAGTDEIPAYVRMNAVLRITGLSRATIYRRIACGLFPKPVHLGGRACGWSTTSLRIWTENPEQYRTAQVEAGQNDIPKKP